MSDKITSYFSSFIARNFASLKKIDKYFRMDISDSMSKAIEENWIRILGIEYNIISVNLCKNNEPLGIALQGRNAFSADGQEIIQRHYLRVIMPQFCFGASNKFLVGDELLEVNGLKVYGMKSKDVVLSLKKLPNYIQIVVARSIHNTYEEASDYGGSEDIHSPISFYGMDEDTSSRTCTLKSNSSLFSSTSRDYGSAVSVGGLIDGRYENVGDYLQNIIGWRGPIVLEFRKRGKESLGLALEEIKDPTSSQLIIVFKIILLEMKAGKDGRLHVGDRLLQVNGKSINGIPFRKVCQWMKSAIGGRLVLYICKPHFQVMDSTDYLPDNYLYHTLTETDKLPKLNEETNDEYIEIPPVPKRFENDLKLLKNGNKLGLFLDVVDNGKNGCRIKKITKGLAKENGILKEGDYVTMINGISLRVDEKNKLGSCLRLISQCKGVYKITFLKSEDIDFQKLKYSNDRQNQSPLRTHYPNICEIMSTEKSSPRINCPSYDDAHNLSKTFEIYQITIENDETNQLGLVLRPSLYNPMRYVAVSDINKGSLGDLSQLQVNDELLSVNNICLEFKNSSDVEFYLKKMINIESILRLKIKRLLNPDDGFVGTLGCTLEIENQYTTLSNLPDYYFCTIPKSQNGFGFGVIDLGCGNGVTVRDIEPESSASKISMMRPGQRIVMVNNVIVQTSSVSDVINTIKSSKDSLGLMIETTKFRELNVRIIKDSSNSLGLNIAGGIDTKSTLPIIESIVPDTMCQYSSTLQPEDLILEANGCSMFNHSHDEIIKQLRAVPQESNFKILRKLPHRNREFLGNLSSSSCIYDYLQCSQFSITIKKPVNTISSFGINFGDILILDPIESQILQRYKAVISIEKNSLSEKFAPQVIDYCYLVAVNGLSIDVNMSCVDLKAMVDSGTNVELLLSQDIPYNTLINSECDSPMILSEVDQNLDSSLISYTSPTDAEKFNTSQYKSILSPKSKFFLIDEETEPTRFMETNMDDDSLTECIKSSLSLKERSCSYNANPSNTSSFDFGITLDVIIIPKVPNTNLGFHIFGGIYGGPNGESLPIYVIGVEPNTCNWPNNQKEPFLSNGSQLIELNGYDLTTLDLSIVEKLLKTTEGDWKFKVVKIKI